MLHVWGCGKFGQHGKDTRSNVSPKDGVVEGLKHAQVKLVSCGTSHTIVVAENGKLFGWGNNANGQLGLKNTEGHQDKCRQPQLIETEVSDVLGVACGSQNSYIWTAEGTCIRFGKNYVEDVVRGNEEANGIKWAESSSTAQWLLKGLQVREVACGTRHALFCMIDGSLFACGKNNRGQLGTADKGDTNIPKKILNIQNSVTQIASGSFHSICCTDEGQVYHWGYGPACGCNENIFTPTEVISLYSERIEKVAAGDSHSLALSSYGILFAWGDNSKGQLGKGFRSLLEDEPINLTNLLKIAPCVEIVSRDDTTAAVTQNGSLFLWGSNIWDVLSGGTSMNSFIRSPFKVALNDADILQIALGSWHVAVISKRSRTKENSEGIEEKVDSVTTGGNSRKNACSVSETGRENGKYDHNNNSNYDAEMLASWGKKGEESRAKKDQSPHLDVQGVLADVKSEISEPKLPDKPSSDENLKIDESTLKQISCKKKAEDSSTYIDIAIETVERENNLIFAPLKPKTVHTNPKNGIKLRRYAETQNAWRNEERSRYIYSAGSKEVRSWETYKKGSMLGPASYVTRAVPAWNTESILEITTKLHKKPHITLPMVHIAHDARKNRSRTVQQENGIATGMNRQLNEIKISYNLHILEHSDRRENARWKPDRYIRGFTRK